MMSETESSRELFYSVFVLVSYLAGLIGFGIFYWRQERKIAAVAALLAAALAIGMVWNLAILGFTAFACFYVADRKHRSRFWALPALLLGPIMLFVLLLLPSKPPEESLSIAP
jgi:hypothetical protein